MHYVQATFLDQIYILGSGYNFFVNTSIILIYCKNLREAPLQLHDSRVQKNVS